MHPDRIKILLAMFVSLLLFSSCTGLPEKAEMFVTPGSGQLTVYLNGPDKSVRRVSFVLGGIQVRSVNGQWLDVHSEAMHIDSYALVGNQRRLGEIVIPRGQYEGIKLIIEEAARVLDGEQASLLIPDNEVFIDFDFEIFGQENTTIFLEWDVDDSIPKEHLFAPVLTARLEGRDLPSLKVYVTNEGSHNVSIINRSTDKVVSVVAVGKRPQGIVAGSNGNFVFVANSGSDSISVIDTSTNRVVQTINLGFGDKPRDLAMDPQGRNLFVVNHRTDSVSVIDAFSFQIRKRIAVGKGPAAIDIDTRRRKAYVVNSLSNNVTVVDVFSLAVLGTINVESQPFEVAVDSQDQRAFIVNRGSNNLTVIDSSSDRVVGRVSVGIEALGVAVDPGRDRIFVSKGLSREVLFVKPSLNSITNTVAMEGIPGRLILDPEQRKLFVVNHGANTLTIVDKFSTRKEKVIPVGSRPFGVISTE